MSTEYTLQAVAREGVGKGASRSLRRTGHTPAVIYGGNEAPIAIAVVSKDITKRIYAGGFMTTIATVEVGGKSIRVLPRDYQLDKIKDFPIHIDFLRVTGSMKVKVDVPVVFHNAETSVGLKAGGTLNIVRHTVELMVPADHIPEHIDVDLKNFKLGESIHISHVKLPDDVKPVISDRDFTIATIAVPAGIDTNAAAVEAKTEK
jgi:large subunit ribosomal protein L25